MKNSKNNNKPAKAKKQASTSSMRLALESRLLFDGAVVAAADPVIDQKPQDTHEDPVLDNASEKDTPAALGNFFQPTEHAQAFAITQAASFGTPGAASLLVVDPRAPGLGELLKEPGKDQDIRILDPKKDGFEQIADILKERGNTGELHIQAAEVGGKQMLGGSQISRGISLDDSQALMHWGDHLSQDASVTFHSSSLPSGQPWLNHVRALTGGAVAWSRDSALDDGADSRSGYAPALPDKGGDSTYKGDSTTSHSRQGDNVTYKDGKSTLASRSGYAAALPDKGGDSTYKGDSTTSHSRQGDNVTYKGNSTLASRSGYAPALPDKSGDSSYKGDSTTSHSRQGDNVTYKGKSTLASRSGYAPALPDKGGDSSYKGDSTTSHSRQGDNVTYKDGKSTLASRSGYALALPDNNDDITSLVIVDPTVANYQTLLDQVDPAAAVFILDPNKDGVAQIANIVSQYDGLNALHLISHGDAGELRLGSGVLDLSSITGHYADELADIKNHLSGNADILIYGCNFGEGVLGMAASARLAQATGADVASSTDATGAANLGGDWTLENSVGAIDTQSIASTTWEGVLSTAVPNQRGAIVAVNKIGIYSINVDTGKATLIKAFPASIKSVDGVTNLNLSTGTSDINAASADLANGLIYFTDSGKGTASTSDNPIYAYDFFNDTFIQIAVAGSATGNLTALNAGLSLNNNNQTGASWANGFMYLGKSDNTSGGTNGPFSIWKLTMSPDGRSITGASKLVAATPATGSNLGVNPFAFGDLYANTATNELYHASADTFTKYDLTTGAVKSTVNAPGNYDFRQFGVDEAGNGYGFGLQIRQYNVATNTLETAAARDITINGTPVTVAAATVMSDNGGFTPATGSIGDTVFTDTNANGTFDAGDVGIANVTVQLIQDFNGNGVVDAVDNVLATDTTDASGKYLFTGVLPSSYIVRVNDANGVLGTLGATTAGLATATGGNTVTSSKLQQVLIDKIGENDLTHDFGFQPDTDKDGVGNNTDLDDDNDGILDTNEGFTNATVTLTFQGVTGGVATFGGTDPAGNPITMTIAAPGQGATGIGNALIDPKLTPATYVNSASIAKTLLQSSATITLWDGGSTAAELGIALVTQPAGESALVFTSNALFSNIRFKDLDGFDNGMNATNANGQRVNDALAANVAGKWIINSAGTPELQSVSLTSQARFAELLAKGAISEMLYNSVPGAAGSINPVDNADVTFLADQPTNTITFMYEDVSTMLTPLGANREFAKSDFTIASFAVDLSPRDTDSDGIADYLDLDSDNDGISDYFESTQGQAALVGKDTNKDGTISLTEGGGDVDKDGLMDAFDKVTTGSTAPTGAASIGTVATNTDFTFVGGDTLADYIDLDSDADSIPDTVEARLTAGFVTNDGDVSDNDADKDGVIALFDSNDATGTFGGTFVDPVNTDGADTPDYADTDSDNDGILDVRESGLAAVVNVDANGNGIRDNVSANYQDPDGDVNSPQTALKNEINDNTEVAYREITDADGDGLANNLDLDDDNDGILDTVEGTPAINLNLPHLRWDLDLPGAVAPGNLEANTIPELIVNPVNGSPVVAGAGITVTKGVGVWTLGGLNSATLAAAKTNNDFLQFNFKTQPDAILDLDSWETFAKTGVTTYNGRLAFEINGVLVFDGLVPPGTTTGTFVEAKFPTLFTLAANTDYAVKVYLYGSTAGAGTQSLDSLGLNFQGGLDTDGDGIVNSLDLDSDNDGISDYYESTTGAANAALAGKDTNNDGTISLTEGVDVDKDGLMDVFDKDTTSAAKTTAATSLGTTPTNTDGDTILFNTKPGLADYLDLDSDNDGIADTVEARLTAGFVANDGDTRNNDADKDGVIDLFDSNDATGLFGGTFTPPVNTDAAFKVGADTTPDYLDLDSDGDGKTDATERGISIATPKDVNTDGIDDAIIPQATVAYSDPDGIIANNAGVSPSTSLANETGTNLEVAYREILDTDGDGIADGNDLDDDNDGILDTVEDVSINTNGVRYSFTGATSFNGTIQDSATLASLGTESNSKNMIFGAGLSGTAGSPSGTNISSMTETTFAAAVAANDYLEFDFTTAANLLNNSFHTINFATANTAYQYAMVLNPATTNQVIVQDVQATAVPGFQPTLVTNGVRLEASTTYTVRIYFYNNTSATPKIDDLIMGFGPTRDTDADGTINSLDLDSDNDGISDYYESTAGQATLIGKDTNNDGTISLTEAVDVDKDGLMDVFDKVTTGATAATGAASVGTIATNSDSDTRADYLDLDSDADGIADTVEARPTANFAVNDGDVRNNDADKDGVIDLFDSNDASTKVFGGTFDPPVNTDQILNKNPDALPDYLDTDSDGDGKTDSTERGIALVNADVNKDGIDDAIIPTTTPAYSDPDGIINNPQTSALSDEFGGKSELAYRETPLPLTVAISNATTENEGTNLVYLVSLIGGVATTDLTVQLSFSGTAATDGSDYTNVVPATAVIKAGQTSVNVTVATKTDTVLEGNETVVVTLGTISGAPFGVPVTINTTQGVGTGTIVDTTALKVSITDAPTVNETGNLVYTVNLVGGTSPLSDIVIPVTYTGTAANGADYSQVATVTILKGATTGTLTLPTKADAILEGDETVIVTLGTPTLTTPPVGAPAVTVDPAGSSATGIIQDATVLTVGITGTPVVTEGSPLIYTVTLTGGTSPTPITVPLTFTGTATDGTDYTKIVNVVIPANTTTATVTVPTLTDTVKEPDETVIVTIGTPTGTPPNIQTIVGVGTSDTGTIKDNTPLSVSISNATTVNEGSALTYTVSLTGGTSSTPITVPLTYAGTATPVLDYAGNPISVVFAPGETSKTVTVTSKTDTLLEGDETVQVTLGTPTGATGVTVVTGTGIGTIVDTTALSVSISDAPTVNELGNLVYTVNLVGGTSPNSDIEIPVTYTGTAADGADYTQTATVTILKGASSGTLTLPTKADAILEGDETVVVALGTPTLTTPPAGAPAVTVVSGGGIGTGIIQDATQLTVGITGTPVVTEGIPLIYTVTLTGGTSPTPITVPLTFTGTATDGTDYTKIVNVVIPANATSVDVTVPTLTDTVKEPDETVIVTIGTPTGTPPNIQTIVGVGTSDTGTIKDNNPLTVSIGDATLVNEGSALVYTVTLNGGTSATPITVPLTYAGTATTVLDHAGNPVSVTFAPGETSKTVTVATNIDTLLEGNETVQVSLGTPTGATGVNVLVGQGVGIGTIVDTTALSVTIGNAPTVNELGNLVYTVSLVGGTAPTTDIVVPIIFEGTATNGTDYTNVANVTIKAGQTSATLTVPTKLDNILEGDETVVAKLGAPTLATPLLGAPAIAGAGASGTGIIKDATQLTVLIDDAPPQPEGNGLVYVVRLIGGTSSTELTVPLTYTGTATDGTDYTKVIEVKIPAGQTSTTVTIPTTPDTVAEGDETVIIKVGTPTGAPANTPVFLGVGDTGTGIIQDANKLAVSISGAPTVSEGTDLEYTVNLTGGTLTTPITIPLIYAGTAKPVLDITGEPKTVTIPAFATSATVRVATNTDSLLEGDEDVIITLGTPTNLDGTPVSIPISGAGSSGTGIIKDSTQLTVFIDDAPPVLEGTDLIYTVRLTGGTSTTPLIVPLTFKGTATDGTDYTKVVNVTIPANTASVQVPIKTLTDGLLEGDETVIVTVGTPTGAPANTQVFLGAGDDGTGTIKDNTKLTVAISDTPVVNEGVGLEYTVTLTGGTSPNPIIVPVTYTGTAADGSDYTKTVNVTIPANATTATLTVPTKIDTVLEGDETVTVTLQPGTDYTVSTTQGNTTGTIKDLTQLTVQIDDAPDQPEGSDLVYIVRLVGGTSDTPITVPLTYGGTGTPVLDYSGNPISVIIPAGQTSTTVTIPTKTDSLLEGDETVIITVGAPTGAPANTPVFLGIGDTGTGTIKDVTQLKVGISGSPVVKEGTDLIYTVTLTGGTSPTPITVPLTLTGTATDGSDYTIVVDVTIPANATSVQVNVPTLPDTIVEGDETVIVTIGTPTGTPANIKVITGVGDSDTGIIQDNTKLTVAVSGTPVVNENQDLVYTVTMTGGTSPNPIVVPITYTGTALDGSDYTKVLNVTIPANATTATITIPTKTDTLLEGDETVTVTLQPGTGYSVSPTDGSTTGTIKDLTQLTVIIDDAPLQPEGTDLVYVVRLTGGTSPTDITVPLTYGGTRDPVLDVNGEPITVTIPAGQTSTTVTVPTKTDTLLEGDETVIITVGKPTGAPANTPVFLGIGDTGTGTIKDLTQLTVSIDDIPAVTEGNDLVYTVKLNGGTSTTAITVPLTYSGTRDPVLDVNGEPINVVIPAGATSATVIVPTKPDTLKEGDETVIVTLGQPTGAPANTPLTLGKDDTGTGTIIDNTKLVVSVSDTPVVNEGQDLVYTVTLTGGTSPNPIVVPVIYTGTALDGSDYTKTVDVTIPANGTKATLTVKTKTDTLLEGDETVTVTLKSGTDYTVSPTQGNTTGTIKDLTQLTVLIDDAPEQPEGTGLVYLVRLVGGTSPTDITVPLTYGGTGTPVLDYDGNPVQVVIKAGETSTTVTVPTKTDTLLEGDETVIVTVNAPTGAPANTPVFLGIGDTGTGTIKDATQLTITIEDSPTVLEGTDLVYTVKLTGGTSPTEITVPLTFTGTATDGTDFTKVIEVKIPAGATSVDVPVKTLADTLKEGDETVTVAIGKPTGAPANTPVFLGIGDKGDGIIQDNTQLTVSVSDTPVVNEGQDLVYTVTLTGGTSPNDIIVPVTYTGTATDGSDFTKVVNVTIPAGQTTAKLTVPTSTDTLLEGDETVTVTLQPGTDYSVSTTQGNTTGTIKDITALSVTIGDAPTVKEAGDLVYKIDLVGGTAEKDITVPVTFTGTATDGTDYTSVVDVIIPAGATTANLTIPTLVDSLLEGNETVVAKLETPTTTLAGAPAIAGAGATGTGIIQDNTSSGLAIEQLPIVKEGQDLVFKVSLIGATPTTDIIVPVTYSGTAVDNTDYTSVANVLIKAGTTSGLLTITTKTDLIVEGDETVIATIQSVNGIPLIPGGESATGIIEDGTQLTILVDDIDPVPEGTDLVYFVRLVGGISTTDITVPIIYSGKAVDGSDFTKVVEVIIPAGTTGAQLKVPTLIDPLLEGDEIVTVTLQDPTGAPANIPVFLGVGDTGTGTIQDATQLTVAIGDATKVDEGNALEYTVTLTGGTSTTDITVPLTYGGGADPILDIKGQPLTVTIKAGETTATVTVPTETDGLLEGDETVIVTLGDPTGAPANTKVIAGKGDIGTGTIQDATQLTVGISGTPVVKEGTDLIYTVTLTGGTSPTPITVPLTFTGTATDGTDYTTVVNVTIPANATSVDVKVPTLTDTVKEPDETVIVTIGTPTGTPANIKVITGVGDSDTGTIKDDTQLTVSISDTPVVNEGQDLVYTVTLTGGTSPNPITVPVTYTGTALDGSDYTKTVDVTIPANGTTATLTVPTKTDSVLEGDETVTVTLQPGTDYSVSTTQGNTTGTIKDITQLTVQIDDAPEQPEGTGLVYLVRLVGGTSTTDITVPLTYGGTGTPVLDYDGNPVQVVIKAGETSTTVTVPTKTDTLLEGDETVIITVGAPTGAPANTPVFLGIGDTGTGTITDETQLTVGISGTPVVKEGTDLIYTVTLTGGTSPTPITVPLTFTGTATDGTDYTTVVNVTIPANATSVDVKVPTLTDTVKEPDETVIVTIGTPTGTPANIKVIAGVGDSDTGTIQDDTQLTVSISDTPVVEEGTDLVYTVTLTGGTSNSDIIVPVTYVTDTATGIATDGSDYTKVVNVTILAGQTTAKLTVPTLTDTLLEGDETVTVTLQPGADYTVSTTNGSTTGTIKDATQLTVSINDIGKVPEGNGLVYTVTMSGPSTTDITIPLTYDDGIAKPVLDFNGQPVNVIIKAGETSATVTVPSLTDNVLEGDETVIVKLGTPVGAPVGTKVILGVGDTGTGIIQDLTELTVSIDNIPPVLEGTDLVYTVKLSGTSSTDIIVPLTYAGTRDPVLDINDEPISVIIPAGATEAKVTVPTKTDFLLEGDETEIVTLGTPTGAPPTAKVILGVGDTGTGIIQDANQLTVSIDDAPDEFEGTDLVYKVNVTGGTSSTPITIPLTFTGKALDGTDYTIVTEVIIPANATSALVKLPTTPDLLLEGNEDVIVTLGTPSGAPAGTKVILGEGDTGTGIIKDNTQLTVAIGDAGEVPEGNNLVYTVTLTGTSTTEITVPLTYGGGATPVLDHDGKPVIVTIPVGETSVTVTVPTKTDLLLEGDEDVIITLGDPTGAPPDTKLVLGKGDTGTGKILDENELTVVIDDAPTVKEGVGLVYTVRVTNGTSTTPITVPLNYSGTGIIGVDYTDQPPAFVIIPAGADRVTFTVPTLTDTLVEGDETVIVTLGKPAGGPATAKVVLGEGNTGTGVIQDNTDLIVGISATPSVTEGQPLEFTVSLKGVTSLTPVTLPVTYTGTAVDGTDFTGVVNVTIPAGATSATLTVPTLTDSLLEGNETVTVTLVPGNGYTIDPVEGSTTGTIIDATQLQVAISDADPVNEGDDMIFTVTLTGGTATTDITMPLLYAGTAEPVLDYGGVPVFVTIFAGQTTAKITVPTNIDANFEGPETVLVSLGTPVVAPPTGGARISTSPEMAIPAMGSPISFSLDAPPTQDAPIAQAAATPSVIVIREQGTGIINDTTQLTVAISDAPPVREGNDLIYTVTLTGGTSTTAITVPLTYSGTAITGADYDSNPSSVTIPAGASSATVTVHSNTDTVLEGDETVIVTLGTPTGAPPLTPVFLGIGDTGTGTIQDAPPNNPPVAEDDGPIVAEPGVPVNGNLLTNDSDPDNDPLTVKEIEIDTDGDGVPEVIPMPTNGVGTVNLTNGTGDPIGTLTIDKGGNYTFTLQPGYDGPIPPITYTVTDGKDTDKGSLTLVPTSQIPNLPPEAVDDGPIPTKANTSVPGNVLDNDNDPNNDPLIVTQIQVDKNGDGVPDIVPVPNGGDVTVNLTNDKGNPIGSLKIGSDGKYTFTPATGYKGSVPPVTYTVTDGNVPSTATLTFKDVPNAPPVAKDDSAVPTQPDVPVKGNVLVNDGDPDGDPLIVKEYTVPGVPGPIPAGTPATIPGVGKIVITPDGNYTFTPDKGYFGPVPDITYVVTDGKDPDTGVLRFSPVPKPDNIGALIMLSNPPKPLPVQEGVLYPWPVQEFKPLDYKPEIPQRLSMYGNLPDYELYLAGNLRNQLVLEQHNYAFTIPPNTFRHTKPNEKISYKATQVDGSTLPKWIHFDPIQQKFYGKPPKGAKNTEVMVTATDNFGNEAHATFRVIVNKDKHDVTTKSIQKISKPVKPNHHAHLDSGLWLAGKAGFSEQLGSSGRTSRLMESRALLDSLSQL